MKTYCYDVERGYFVNSVGGAVGIVPTLVYGEQAQWRFFFKTAAGTVYDLSGITELNAAVGVAGGGTVAATTEGIALDVTAGSVTVPINCLTEQFYDATQGKPNGVYGFFELTGYDAAQGKALYIRFNTLLNEVVNPDIHAIPGLPDMILGVVSSGGFVTSDTVNAIASGAAENTVSSGGFITSSGAEIIASGAAASAISAGGYATQEFVSSAIGSAGQTEGYVTSGEVEELTSSAVSGAIFSNTEIDTTVGDYRLTYTSGGGLTISGSGASVVLSGGSVVVDGGMTIGGGDVNAGGDMSAINMSAYSLSVDAAVNASAVNASEVNASAVNVNDRPAATQLVTSTDAETTSAYIEVLTGGMSYVYTQPQYQVMVDSVAKSTEASFIHFTLDSNTALVPVTISGYTFASGRFEGGKEYLVGFFDGMCAVNEVTSGGVLQ